MYRILDKLNLVTGDLVNSSNKYIESDIINCGIKGIIRYTIYFPLIGLYNITHKLTHDIYSMYLEKANKVSNKVQKIVVIDTILSYLEPEICKHVNGNIAFSVIFDEFMDTIEKDKINDNVLKDIANENVFMSMFYQQDNETLHVMINVEGIPDGVTVFKITVGLIETLIKQLGTVSDKLCDMGYKDFISSNRELILLATDNAADVARSFRNKSKVIINEQGEVLFQ